MRHVPIRGAKFLGRTTARYRWFSVAYLLGVFFVLPGIILGLSLAGAWIMGSILIVVGLLVIGWIALYQVQKRWPQRLPENLRTWEFLPLCMRSFQPYDDFFLRYICRCRRFQQNEDVGDDDEEMCYDNKAFERQITKI